MLPDTLRAYLQTYKDQGLSFDTLSPVLLNSGWSPEIISTAKDWYSTPTVVATHPLHRSFLKPLVVAVLSLFLLTIAGTTSAYFIATDKISLPADSLVKSLATRLVASLPFLPKTPRMVLTSASLAHKQVSKHKFDLSLALSSPTPSLTEILGSGNLDLAVSGFADYSDRQNPKFSFQARMGTDFSLQAAKNDSKVYLKVDQIPVYLMAIIGLEPDKLNAFISQNWLVLDTSSLDTDARKFLGTTPSSSFTNTATINTLKQLLTEDILPVLTQSPDKLDGQPVYKVVFAPTPEMLDKIGTQLQANLNKASYLPSEKLSDFAKEVRVEVYVDKKAGLVRKAQISGKIVSSGISEMTFAAVLKLSDFGQDQPIVIPESALTPEQFYQQLLPLIEGSTGGILNPSRQFAVSRNTKRRSDLIAITNALYQYAADNNGQLPPPISTTPKPVSKSGADFCSLLTPDYLATLPVDPNTNTQAISDCGSAYDTGYTIYKTPDSKLVAGAPQAELGETISVTR